MGFQGRDEDSLRKAKAEHPSHSSALVLAAARKAAGKELSRAARCVLHTPTARTHAELAAAVEHFDRLAQA